MERRNFLKNTFGGGLALFPFLKGLEGTAGSTTIAGEQGIPGADGAVRAPVNAPRGITSGPKAPLTIYNNWSSYDELSDNIPLTEELAMRELDEVIRLKKNGVQFDYYMMDAFWFDKTGGYRVWHKQHWPSGPDKWLKTCADNGIKPGMWFSTNLISTHSGRFLEPVPEWQDSVGTDPSILCLFSGGYLKHLGETLEMWYNKGVRAFKFDFAYFNAATRIIQETHLPGEIEEMNKLAFMDMLKQFRARHEDVLITGYNGFGGDLENTVTPFRKTVDSRWMEAFDTIYCGDPRFSDVPAMNIWRSQDIYSDHMVRQFEFNGLPLRRIDNCGFMTGKTGTCYFRALQAWKGMLILELARAGWVNVFHGNLELLSDEDARWFARVQNLFLGLQRFGHCSTFGSIPGHGLPYGFKMQGDKGTVLTIVNPSQGIVSVDLPSGDLLSGDLPSGNFPSGDFSQSAILYADGGFMPLLEDKKIQLGPEQLVVIGLGEYAGEAWHFGVDDSIQIPIAIDKVETEFKETAKNTIRATLSVKQIPRFAGKPMATPAAPVTPAMKKTGDQCLRVLFQQYGADGLPRRSWGGAPPDGKKMNELLQIRMRQGKRELPLLFQYDKMIWSGLSWGMVELKMVDLDRAQPLEIVCFSAEGEKLALKAQVFAVTYSSIR